MKASLRNVAGVVSAIVLTIAYFEILGERIPASYAAPLNFLLVPFLLGIASSFLLEGPLWLKLILLLAIPVVHVWYFGGDQGKPGLENFLAAIEYGSLCLGVVTATLLRKLMARTSVAI